jgi:GntR family transcriptional regulator
LVNVRRYPTAAIGIAAEFFRAGSATNLSPLFFSQTNCFLTDSYCISTLSTVARFAVEFQCDPTSRVPIYRQLMDQVRHGIARGKMRPGERLPSVRAMSRELVVNPNTVARAYTELEREGVLNTRQGLGVFVAEPQAELTIATRRERFTAALDCFLTEAVHLGLSSDEVTSAVDKQIKNFQFTMPTMTTPASNE